MPSKLTELATEIRNAKIKTLQQWLSKQRFVPSEGHSNDDRIYRVGWNDAMRSVELFLDELEAT